MIQIVEQTHEERVKMYMRCTKKELAEMLANWSEVAGLDSALTLRRPRRRADELPPPVSLGWT